MAKEGRRALLTDREREIVAGDADVSDEYRYQTVSRVRKRLDRLEGDIQALEAHGALADELREKVCDETEGSSKCEERGCQEEATKELEFDDGAGGREKPRMKYCEKHANEQTLNRRVSSVTEL